MISSTIEMAVAVSSASGHQSSCSNYLAAYVVQYTFFQTKQFNSCSGERLGWAVLEEDGEVKKEGRGEDFCVTERRGTVAHFSPANLRLTYMVLPLLTSWLHLSRFVSTLGTH